MHTIHVSTTDTQLVLHSVILHTGEGGEGRRAGLGEAIDQVRSGGLCAQLTHDCLQNCRNQQFTR